MIQILKPIIGVILLAFPLVAMGQGEQLLVGGCAWDKVAVIDKDSGLIVWSHTINAGEDCNHVEMTRRGDVLYAYNLGARLIDFKSQDVIWDYKAPAGCELFTSTELDNGNFMLAMCGTPARIVELDSKGKMISEITFDTGIEQVHGQFRQILKRPDGNYIIPFMQRGEVSEMTPEGEILRTVKTEGNHFSVNVMADGSWLVSCGDGHRIAQLDPASGREIRSIESSDVEGADLLFVAQVVPLKNGNLLIANWPGHSPDKTQPKLLEIDKTGKIAWKLENTPEIGNISSVFVINNRHLSFTY